MMQREEIASGGRGCAFRRRLSRVQALVALGSFALAALRGRALRRRDLHPRAARRLPADHRSAAVSARNTVLAVARRRASDRRDRTAPWRRSSLVRAVIRVESNFDPKAVSPKGAAGLMQLMPETAMRYGVENRFDPAQNVDGGVRYLRDLMAMFDGNLSLAPRRLQRRRGRGSQVRAPHPALPRNPAIRRVGALVLQPVPPRRSAKSRI
jgi:soluble lytic murein transglycosylase-like protein